VVCGQLARQGHHHGDAGEQVVPHAEAFLDVQFRARIDFDLHKTYITDALTAGDAEIDYAQYDIYYILASNTPNIGYSPTWIPRGQGRV
jgi:hypothetical protein